MRASVGFTLGYSRAAASRPRMNCRPQAQRSALRLRGPGYLRLTCDRFAATLFHPGEFRVKAGLMKYGLVTRAVRLADKFEVGR